MKLSNYAKQTSVRYETAWRWRLYRAADGRHLNADANGAYNIVRKVAPDAFAQGSRGCVAHPVRLAV